MYTTPLYHSYVTLSRHVPVMRSHVAPSWHWQLSAQSTPKKPAWQGWSHNTPVRPGLVQLHVPSTWEQPATSLQRHERLQFLPYEPRGHFSSQSLVGAKERRISETTRGAGKAREGKESVEGRGGEDLWTSALTFRGSRRSRCTPRWTGRTPKPTHCRNSSCCTPPPTSPLGKAAHKMPQSTPRCSYNFRSLRHRKHRSDMRTSADSRIHSNQPRTVVCNTCHCNLARSYSARLQSHSCRALHTDICWNSSVRKTPSCMDADTGFHSNQDCRRRWSDWRRHDKFRCSCRGWVSSLCAHSWGRGDPACSSTSPAGRTRYCSAVELHSRSFLQYKKPKDFIG